MLSLCTTLAYQKNREVTFVGGGEEGGTFGLLHCINPESLWNTDCDRRRPKFNLTRSKRWWTRFCQSPEIEESSCKTHLNRSVTGSKWGGFLVAVEAVGMRIGFSSAVQGGERCAKFQPIAIF